MTYFTLQVSCGGINNSGVCLHTSRTPCISWYAIAASGWPRRMPDAAAEAAAAGAPPKPPCSACGAVSAACAAARGAAATEASSAATSSMHSAAAPIIYQEHQSSHVLRLLV
jgi:hypothetical protein